MRFSAWLSTGWTWDEVHAAAIHADTSGWDGIWVPDHFMPPKEGYGSEPDGVEPELGPVHESWTFLTAIAAVTQRARVGVLVSGNTYRHPAVVAKMAVSLDHISHGRAILGLGAGWQENEHERYGFRYGTVAERAGWLDEAAAVITGLLTQERTEHRGARYTLEGAPLEPKPVQARLPLLIGGAGERRTLSTVARYATHWNMWGAPERFGPKLERLREHCEAIERDPAEITVSANAMFLETDDPDLAGRMGTRGGLVGAPEHIRRQIAAYSDAGVHEIVVAGFNHAPAAFAEVLDRLRQIAG